MGDGRDWRAEYEVERERGQREYERRRDEWRAEYEAGERAWWRRQLLLNLAVVSAVSVAVALLASLLS